MNRPVYVTAISCLIVGTSTGHLVTRWWSLNSMEDRAKVVHDRITPTKKVARESTSPSHKMEKVTGIGGFFFRGKNSGKLNEWYDQHLGVRKVGEKDEHGSWWQNEGPTVFAAESETAQVGGPEHTWRINFRVKDLDAMVAQLRAAGLSVKVDAENYPNGRFAHLLDPDGNSIELWEPAGADLVRPPDQQ